MPPKKATVLLRMIGRKENNMDTLAICGGLFVVYYIIGLAYVLPKGSGNLITGLFLSLIWPILMVGDAL